MKSLIKKYSHIWVLGYALIYGPWFCYLEKNTADNYAIVHTAVDDLIPFEEWFIIPYLLWFVYIAAAGCYFFFYDKEGFYRYSIFLIIGMTTALLIYTFFPNATDLRIVVDPQKDILCRLIGLIQKTDPSTNVCPSIHVYNSIGTHIALSKNEVIREKRGLCRASAVLALLICASTVFLKQHSVVDILGALLMAMVVYPLVYRENTAAVTKRAAV